MSNLKNLTGLTHSIPLDQAVAMTRRYRDHRNEILKPEYANRDILAICETFNKVPIQALAENPACVGIRIYYGMSEDLLCHAILVGVNDLGEDILPASARSASSSNLDGDDDDGEILEDSVRCPTVCPPDSPLNDGP